MFAPHPLLDDVCSHVPERAAVALQAAHGRGDELVPGIVARIEAAATHPEESLGEEKLNVGFLLFLAAEFRATTAHEPLIRLLRRHDGRAFELLGDIITEQAPTILADTYPGTPEPLLALVRDEAADPFARNAGLRALAVLWNRNHLSRTRLIEELRQLAATLDPEEENDPLVGNGIVDVALLIHATELAELVRELYSDGLIELAFASPDRVDHALRPDAPADSESPFLSTTITDAWEELRRWPFFRPESRSPKDKREPDRGRTAAIDLDGKAIPYSAPPKVGRNDPCHCGSGKKFKECCGA